MATNNSSLKNLRTLAERLLVSKPKPEFSPDFDSVKLLHELQVHQIELELQNEELRSTQLSLEESRERYRDLYEFAPVGYVILSATGTIASINLTGCKLLAANRTQLLNQLFTLQVNDADSDRWQIFFWNLLRSHSHKSIELALKRADNFVFYALLDGECFSDENQAHQIRLAVTDISERRQAEITIKEANRLAEKANRLQSEFLANMSHEIRTPMNAIIGMSHLAQRTELTGKQSNYLNKIAIAAHSLLGIINNLLDFSKIEAGKLELEQVTFSLAEVFTHLEDLVGVMAMEKNSELVFFIAEKTPKYLVGDSLRLSQILLNLLNNAVKFTAYGKIRVSVECLEQTASDVKLQFAVQDDGIGITQEQIQRLFRPFSQADSSISRQYGGTGLGLAISLQLAKMMGGKIWVKSQIDSGSTFYFTAKFTLAEHDSPARTTPEHTTPISLAGQKVLLVEDDAINRELATELLTDLGIQVKIAQNGQQAVNLVKTEIFDLVLMDIQMPEMDGLTATRLIRADRRFHDLPIIAVSAHAMSCDRQKSLEAGMNDYISKPINPKKLVELLSYWLKAELKPPAKMTSEPLKSVNDIQLPDELPPFNLAQALLRAKGNSGLVHKLILMFHADFHNSSEKLCQLISDGNYEEARRLIHKLKGAAMILAIDELPAIAEASNRAIESRNIGKINLYLKTLDSALEPALQAAASLLPSVNQN